MTATAKLALITEALAAGKTVYLCTYTGATKITAKNAAKWTAAGRPIVKATETSLYVASGKNYLCADLCAIRVED